jgi:DNA-binding CsgD family transcriptional regulator
MKKSAAKKFGLTPRQADVARELKTGQDRKTIADRLGITIWQVDRHLIALRRKLNSQTTGGVIATLGQYR